MFEYRPHFPYPEIRTEQDVAIAFALDAFLAQGKKFVILELGTGCGKSAVGITIARYLNSIRQDSEDFKAGAYVLTTQKVLQEQYMGDFGPPNGCMASIKSAANFQCDFYKNNTCSDSLRLVKLESKGSPFFRQCMLNCTYKNAKQTFLDASEGVTNFSYFLAETMYGGKIKPRDLLIIDEAHNVENELSKFVEVSLTERFTTTVLRLQWPTTRRESELIDWISSVYVPTLRVHIAAAESELEMLKGAKDKTREFTDVARQHEMLDKHVCKVVRFLEMYSEDNWVLNLIAADGKSLRKMEFKPVDVGPFANDLLFRFGKRVILMSATIVNRDVFCESIGLDPNDVAFLSLDSPFPIENRPIFYLPVGSMAMDQIDSTLPKMVEAIKLILEQHKGEKGIIHAHTFKIANFLKKHIKNRRLLIHDSSNRDQKVQEHISSTKATVLISPSLSEGIDLRDDLSRFQVICKMPYPYLGDKIVKKRMNKHKGWYPFQTAKTIVQSVGRSIRNDKDHAVTYILDENWQRFFSQHSSMFPDSFKRALQS